MWASTLPALNPTPIWYGTGVETAVTIPLTAIGLCAWGWRARAGRAWIVFALAFVVLCLGPRLRVGGVVTPMRMPFAIAKRVPGLDVMRTPGRYMFIGGVGFALAAGAALSALARRHPANATALVTAASVLAAVECWPRAWPQSALPRVPAFYRQLAADPAGGAVLDLPHGLSQHAHNASAYMYYQTIHHRPIAWSYLSRSPLRHPNAGLDGLWAAEAPAGPLLRARLRALGYRYVVVHRDQSIFLDGSVAEGRPGAAVECADGGGERRAADQGSVRRRGAGARGRPGDRVGPVKATPPAWRRTRAALTVPLGYLALAIAASWPLARDFATYTVGDIHYDERHAIWVLWYTAQALAARVSWPDTTQLLFPHGISVLVDGVGPLNGVLALPFWPWGAAAAFNGTALLGVALSRLVPLRAGPRHRPGARPGLRRRGAVPALADPSDLAHRPPREAVRRHVAADAAGRAARLRSRARERMAGGARRGAARRLAPERQPVHLRRRSASRSSACRRGWQRPSTNAPRACAAC